MALEYTIQTNYGYTCSYWKITLIHHDILKDTVECQLYGYKDKIQRETENSLPLLRFTLKIYKNGFVWHCNLGDITFSIDGMENESFSLPLDITRTWLYQFIKTPGLWNSAVDV